MAKIGQVDIGHWDEAKGGGKKYILNTGKEKTAGLLERLCILETRTTQSVADCIGISCRFYCTALRSGKEKIHPANSTKERPPSGWRYDSRKASPAFGVQSGTNWLTILVEAAFFSLIGMFD